jgi:hypothetical protein
MTATDQDEAADRFAHYIDKILRPYVPEASRWTLACQIVKAAREEHWRCMPPAPDVARARQAGDPPNETYEAAKAAITRKEDRDD